MYVIHRKQDTERDISQFIAIGCEVIEPIKSIIISNSLVKTHISILQKDKNDVIIFEDDADIKDDKFLNEIDKEYDIIYFGVNCEFLNAYKFNLSYGTHSMYISSKGKEKFLKFLSMQSSNYTKYRPIDIIWNDVVMKMDLKVKRLHLITTKNYKSTNS